jgi:hypothetical protein
MFGGGGSFSGGFGGGCGGGGFGGWGGGGRCQQKPPPLMDPTNGSGIGAVTVACINSGANNQKRRRINDMMDTVKERKEKTGDIDQPPLIEDNIAGDYWMEWGKVFF